MAIGKGREEGPQRSKCFVVMGLIKSFEVQLSVKKRSFQLKMWPSTAAASLVAPLAGGSPPVDAPIG